MAVAALVFVANDPDQAPADEAVTRRVSKPTSTPDARRRPTDERGRRRSPRPSRSSAARSSSRSSTTPAPRASPAASPSKAKTAGWNVVGSDNWYGTIDGTSVYYPPRLKAAARALGRDLGIKKLRPAEEPMRFDRVTVILTDDYR